MAKIRAFKSVRPQKKLVSSIAALPYDVYSREEAKAIVDANPMSFLKIDRAETQFLETTDMYSQQIYEKARDTLANMITDHSFICESQDSYYIYELTMNGHSQTGIVGCAAIDDYLDGTIMKHENTRSDKEADRIRHVDICNAQTGPIFLTYRSHPTINDIVNTIKAEVPEYNFVSEDGVQHVVWCIHNASTIQKIQSAFETIPKVYIADGHHRAASAVKVGLKRRERLNSYSGNESFNYFLSVLFPDEQLQILDYNRFVHDLGGHTPKEFLAIIAPDFDIKLLGNSTYRPSKKGTFGMYLNGNWYALIAKRELCNDDPVNGLDVSILQNSILAPVLGIKDPKTDTRISFIGGIRGLDALKTQVDHHGDGVAFAMFPTSMEELFSVSDTQQLMPPKSTWFEPKLRSGLFIHQLEGDL